MKKNADDLYPFYILFIFLMFLISDNLNRNRPRTALSIHLLVLNPVLYFCVQPKLFTFNNQIDKLNAGSENHIFRYLTQCLLNWLSVARSSYKNSK